jgi:glycosyltransferase involved in cell wall biosynthesis
LIVDDNSTDKTLEIAKKYNCRIITVPNGKFSHPYSCNLGAENACGEFIVYLNGHALPISNTWLEDGLKNFKDEKVIGVYATNVSRKKSTLADKLLYDIIGYTYGSIKFKATSKLPGLLGTTNCIIKKEFWSKKKFDESFNNGWGGEDSKWASDYIDSGYIIIHDPKFRVRHSHNLKLKDIFWQLKNWMKMAENSKMGLPEKQRKNL